MNKNIIFLIPLLCFTVGKTEEAIPQKHVIGSWKAGFFSNFLVF
jgi:hypothetical protein